MIDLTGLSIPPIWVQIAQILAAICTVITVMGGIVLIWWHEWHGRAFDRWLVTRTIVEPNGNRRLVCLRNIGSSERFDDAIRGNSIRRRMTKAAHRCNLDQPFIDLGSDAAQREMLHATLNALTSMNVAGETAEAAGIPVLKKWMLFAVTGVDASGGAVHMFRIQFVDEGTLREFLDTSDNWDFENGQEEHRTRTRTLAKMARAHFFNDGRLKISGRSARIIGSFELKVPVPVAKAA